MFSVLIWYIFYCIPDHYGLIVKERKSTKMRKSEFKSDEEGEQVVINEIRQMRKEEDLSFLSDRKISLCDANLLGKSR